MALEAQAAVESRREAGRGYITEEMEFSIERMDRILDTEKEKQTNEEI